MRAWLIEGNKLVQKELPKPIPKKGEVLLKVKAFALNRADVLQVQGKYPNENGKNIPGLELSGYVEGKEDLCAALVKFGAYAEYVAVNENHIININSSFTHQEAACIPEALVTCYLNLFQLGNIENANSVLIHGGTSGIGTTAIQIAKSLGLKVFSTASTDAKVLKIKQTFDIENVFKYSSDWVKKIKEEGGVDLVLDILGGGYLSQNISALNKYGRLIMIATMAGIEAEVKTSSILMKNISIIGSTLRSKSDLEKSELINSSQRIIKCFKPLIDSEFCFADVDKAHQKMIDRGHFGKIVINV